MRYNTTMSLAKKILWNTSIQVAVKILSTIIHKFKGGPVGITTIATAVGEEAGTIEEVHEPFLIMEGYIQRTPRGREATERAYRHIGVVPPGRAGTLFDGQDTAD